MSALEIEKHGKTTLFTINRTEIKNAINEEVTEKLYAGFKAFDDSDQRVAVITGAGKHFSGGADVTNLPPALWKALPTLGLVTDKPIIAAVNGFAAGGAFMMTVLSDLCIASETAFFHYPEAKFGLTGGVAGTLASRIAHKHAMEILLLARPIPAARAYEMGLVNEVVPEGMAVERALEVAKELEQMAPLVLKGLKHIVTEHTLPHTPSEVMSRQRRFLETILLSNDRTEGINAFLEGRDCGNFTGT